MIIEERASPELLGYPTVKLAAASLLRATLFRGSALDETLSDQSDLHFRALERMRGYVLLSLNEA